MDCKQELVKRLKEDCEVLMKNKIPKALENISDDKGVNTYRNLTKALADNIKLIEEYEKEEWKPMWSIYRTDDKTNPKKTKSQVAVWMQNDKGDIKGHNAFDINYEINEHTEADGVCSISFDKIEDGTLVSKTIKELEDKQQATSDLLKMIIDMLKNEKHSEIK